LFAINRGLKYNLISIGIFFQLDTLGLKIIKSDFEFFALFKNDFSIFFSSL